MPGPASPADARLEPADTAVNPVIQAESVSIPTPAWGTTLMVDDAEVVVAELVEDEEPAPPAAAPAAEPIPDPAPARGPRRPVLGWLAAAVAIATAVFHGLAVAVATARDPDSATTFAWISIGLSLGGVLLGVAAVVFRSGRAVGVVAAIVALLANPWVLLQVLTFFAP